MFTLRRLDTAQIDWEQLDAFGDRLVFQTRDWLAFLTQAHRGTAIVAEVLAGKERIGFFTGVRHRRFGVTMLGSPSRGFATPYLGFNLRPGVERRALVPALEDFAFGQLGCVHLELHDRFLSREDGLGAGLSLEEFHSYESDLTLSETDLFAGMSSACRRCIRRAQKLGVIIEESKDAAFADDYYAQLQDVFAKQQLVPTYDVERVRRLIAHLAPTGRLLLLRARAPDSTCIATLIVVAARSGAFFWGNASYRSGQTFRPNEALHWYAMRYWKARGVERYDWGGPGAYKAKYGGAVIAIPWFYRSRVKLLEHLREGARRMFETQQRVRGWARSVRYPVPAAASDEGDV